ncbi:hypothetical protein L3Y34_005342 [Caenorhabditis briggsae]|uniref:BHLH domain-containing protein n=1 Tax=Caenorhabditis briggsae TaxID=6238 RepID=A0AAE9AHK2_CAEBR|nr:hypothetical protein L3Y34_005342 [Caenorhabditis briggsae]
MEEEKFIFTRVFLSREGNIWLCNRYPPSFISLLNFTKLKNGSLQQIEESQGPTDGKRLRANMRERQRVSQMNEMFDVLISLLPPSEFRLRFSRAQALREAAKYINQLIEHLETSDDSDAITKFPHIFLEERRSKTVNYRTPVNSSSVTAFISRHDLSVLTPLVSQNPIYPSPPTTSFIISGSFEPFFHG